MNDKSRIVMATIAGFGLIFFGTLMAVRAMWVVDGLTGKTRLASTYIWVLLPIALGLFVFFFTVLVYYEWSGKLKLSANELRIKALQRAALGSISIGILVVSVLLIPSLAGLIDIGGSELPESDSWKPFSVLWGALVLFSILCFVSAIWAAIERHDRLGGLA